MAEGEIPDHLALSAAATNGSEGVQDSRPATGSLQSKELSESKSVALNAAQIQAGGQALGPLPASTGHGDLKGHHPRGRTVR
jgi:hypothetical protein